MRRRILLGILGTIFLILLVCCALHCDREMRERSCTEELFAMDTVMRFTAHGKNCEEAVAAAMREVQRLDALLSTGSASSEISKLNAAGTAEISEDTAALLRRGQDIYGKTDGLFDVTVYPLMCLWGFPSKEYHVPSEEELEAVLPLVDGSKVSLEDGRAYLGDGQKVDLGGIAKGYASGRVMEIYREYGITSGMVSLGGNVQVLNGKPDGSLWRIGIQDPDAPQGTLAAVLDVENCAVITSGGYERYFEEDGNTYIHIIDPRTGYPAAGDLASVTIVSEDGTLADALSTSLYIMGLEDAVSYWRTYGDDFEMVLITSHGELYGTEGICGQLRAEGEIRTVRRDASPF